MDWSPRAAGRWCYGDEEHRCELYRLLLDVGQAIDVTTYVGVDELALWADELSVSRDARAARSARRAGRELGPVSEGLSRSQRSVIAPVMSSIAQDGCVMVGGSALVVPGVSERPTEDPDAFSASCDDEPAVANACSATSSGTSIWSRCVVRAPCSHS